jgi:integrase
MRIKLTPKTIEKLATPGVYWDQAMAGFGVVVTPALHKSFCVQYRTSAGVSRRATLKLVLGLDGARSEARKIQGDVERGLDPVGEDRAKRRAVKTTLAAVFDLYEKLEGGKLRSAAGRRALFINHVLPTLGGRPIADLRRGEIVSLLDSIEANVGARTANLTLALLSRMMGWYAIRNEDFRSPIVKGMARQNNPERDRVLSDDEIRALWVATTDLADPFHRLLRFILLTATRRDEAAAMRWSELDGGVWTLPASRVKTKAEMVIPLSEAARSILASVAKVGPGEWVFTLDGRVRIRSFGGRKRALDARMLGTGLVNTLPRWTTHDLRRTARSLMSRAGVAADIGERCLGHLMPKIRRTYDRHSYMQEKAQAFEALAGMIERIINPTATTDNVVKIRGKA